MPLRKQKTQGKDDKEQRYRIIEKSQKVNGMNALGQDEQHQIRLRDLRDEEKDTAGSRKRRKTTSMMHALPL